MPTLSCDDFARLMAVVEGLGGKAPPSVTAALGSVEVLREAAWGQQVSSPETAMRDAVRQAAADGQPIGLEEARALCKSLAVQRLVSSQISEHLPGVDLQTAQLVHQMLQGDAGDELMDGLRPVVDRAIQGIQDASAFFGPDTSAAQVVEMGADATEAWRQAGEHQAMLDRILNELLWPITREIGILPPELTRDAVLHGLRLIAVWVINPSRAYLLDEVGNTLLQPMSAFSAPGGRWLAIHQLSGLHLNSPREAMKILSGIQESRIAEEEERRSRVPKKAPEFHRPKVVKR